jgi:drug/metabolite transporter (DMT)-like permease
MQANNWKPYGALVALCFLWGTTYLGIRIGVQHFPPFLFSGLRFVISGLLILGWFAAKKETVWPTKKELLSIFISGAFIFIGGNLFLVLGEMTVPSGLAALVNTAFPLWIVIITRIWNPVEKTPLLAIIGILIGFAGQWLIFYEQLFLLQNSAYFVGFIILVLGVINGSLGSIYMKKTPVKVSPVLNGGLQMLLAGTITTIIGMIKGEIPLLNSDAEGWWAMIYLIIAGSILGYSLFVYAMYHLPATMVSVYAYINPIVALGLGYLLLKEPISERTVYAMIVTLTGVFIVNRGMVRARKKNA